MSLLDIRNLNVEFGPRGRAFPAVQGMTLQVDAGEVVGIVGESGSGKSVTMLALMGLIDSFGRVTAERLNFDGKDLLSLSDKQRRQLVGKDIAMIFQDPMTSLNPSYTVGYQIIETLKVHQPNTQKAMWARALELLKLVEIPDAESRLNAYPHQLSGGMSQRVMIAMALACNPRLLIADEPTTALDVTIQAQVLELLLRLQKQNNMALILITHDLAVVAEIAQRVVVMYAGQVVETAPVPEVFEQPHHPYTEALLKAIPELSLNLSAHSTPKRLPTLPGVVPSQYNRPRGCLLAPRCPYAKAFCEQQRPMLEHLYSHQVRCFYPLHEPVVPGQDDVDLVSPLLRDAESKDGGSL